MGRLTRRQTIAVKTEVIYGTDPIPAATDIITIEAPKIKVNGDALEREALNDTLSRRGHVIGMKDIELEFVTELKGSGIAGTPPEVGPLLKAASMTEAINISAGTVTYTLNSLVNPSSVTVYFNADGVLHKITGARTSWKYNWEAGKEGKINWKIRGLYNAPIDSVLVPDGSVDTILPPICQACNQVIGGYSPTAEKIEIDVDNNLVRSVSLNAAQAIKEIRISARNPKGSFNPEAVLEAEETFWADWEAATKQSFSIRCGSVSGNTVTMTGYLQKTGMDYGDRDGIMTYEIPFGCPYNTTGNDELVIVYS